ncbi:hypothetical protein C9374_005935 [Naegleria lovaniensis]|uniref:Protein kinase domain-containing protein n=1 Tax=Naegleria lovaniensis TaxID=51637 RepID=A0AA88GLZ1_NAELO|nr:uncharacterized protein C9374_005935 [Naegleria lovaniensis]KAG2381551.1 hypothetical protein C9374_005935 [Naegleria lovaniensis]
MSTTPKVLVRYYSSHHAQPTCVVVKLSSTYSSLVKDLKEKFMTENSIGANDLLVSYYDPNEKETIHITTNDCLEWFLQFFHNPQIEKSYKVLSVQWKMNENIVTHPLHHDSQQQQQQLTTSSYHNYMKQCFKSCKLIGSGAYGQVYRVESEERISAVKIIRYDEFQNANEILREFQKLVQFEHEHIVKTHGAFFAGSTSVIGIEMELMQGSLQDLIIEKQIVLSEKMLLQILHQTCRAMEFIEKSKKVVHRDIKPANILVRQLNLDSEEIQVALSDFGQARSLGSINDTGTAGTPLYYAPEVVQQLMAKHEDESACFSFASDVFALGVSMYQLMTFDVTTFWSTAMSTLNSQVRPYVTCRLKKSYSNFLIDLIISMMTIHVSERLSISQTLQQLHDQEQRMKLTSTSTSISTSISTLVNSSLESLNSNTNFEENSPLLFSAVHSPSNNENAYLYGKNFYDHGNYSRARNYLERAAHQGHAQAQYLLGDMYQHGREMERNLSTARHWYERAAQQGHDQAQNNLAYMLKMGEGGKKDLSLAFEWFDKSAQQGNSEAQYYLGQWYEDGDKDGMVKKSIPLATVHYLQSAQLGNVKAQYSLGRMYEIGKGEKNLIKAKEWYERAAKQGYVAAQNKLKSLEKNKESKLNLGSWWIV